MLLCAKCPGARRGPDSRAVKKSLKKALGKRDALRVLEVDCLKVCPDDAVTACIVEADEGAVSVQLVRSDLEVESLAEALRAKLERG